MAVPGPPGLIGNLAPLRRNSYYAVRDGQFRGGFAATIFLGKKISTGLVVEGSEIVLESGSSQSCACGVIPCTHRPLT